MKRMFLALTISTLVVVSGTARAQQDRADIEKAMKLAMPPGTNCERNGNESECRFQPDGIGDSYYFIIGYAPNKTRAAMDHGERVLANYQRDLQSLKRFAAQTFNFSPQQFDSCLVFAHSSPRSQVIIKQIIGPKTIMTCHSSGVLNGGFVEIWFTPNTRF